MTLHYRQGDILLIKINSLPPEALEVEAEDRIVLAYGEVTGHAHAVDSNYATMYAWNDDRLLAVRPGARLVHEEHAAIVLEPGLYKVVRQREFLPEGPRVVRD